MSRMGKYISKQLHCAFNKLIFLLACIQNLFLCLLYQVLNKLNKYGLCLTSQMKYPILDDIGNHFMDRAVELVKKGHKFVFVMDNIDWTIEVHEMRFDHQNKDVHAVATSLVFDHVPKKEFSSDVPQQSLTNVNVRGIVTPTAEEMACTRERYKILLGNIICEYLQAYQVF